MPFAVSNQTIAAAGTLEDSFVAPTASRPNDFTPLNPSVVNVVNVGIAPPAPTTGTLATTIEYAQGIVSESVAEYGVQETPVVITLLETLEDAALLAEYLIRSAPAFWFGNIQIIMNGLTDAQRTTINNLDIGSQVSVTKSFPKSTPSTVTQLMAIEGISHDITPDRHIVTLYPNPARIYTYFIVAGYPVVATRTNLVTNPNFEVNTTGWTGSGTFARTTAEFYSGIASLSLTYTGAGIVTVEQSPRINVTAGLTYTASFYLKQSVNTGSIVCNFMWYNAGGSLVLDDTHQYNDASTTWQRFSQTRTAPANAVSCTFRIYQFNGEGGGAVATVNYVDAVLVEQASSALPYFDGTYVDNYTGYGLNSKTWNGTANASTSTATWYQGATRTNLVTNPNFEVNTTGWIAYFSTGTRDTTDFYSGTASYKIVASGAQTYFSAETRSSISPSTQYTFSYYVKATVGTPPARATINWYTAAGGFISQTAGTNSTTTNSWGRRSVTGTAPANAAQAYSYVEIPSGAVAGTTIFVDGAMLEQASSALPYFDGTYADTYAGYTLQSQSWSGTANASTSTATWGLTSAFVGSELDDDTKGLG
jgi:hypothetical protein